MTSPLALVALAIRLCLDKLVLRTPVFLVPRFAFKSNPSLLLMYCGVRPGGSPFNCLGPALLVVLVLTGA
jgi:hypothetical protein